MLNIRVKNFLCFFITISVIAGIGFVLVYQRAKKEVLNAVVENLQMEFDNQQNEINDVFSKIERAGDYLNYSRYVYELITTKIDDDVVYTKNVMYLMSEYRNAYDLLLSQENASIYTDVLFLDKSLPIARNMIAAQLETEVFSDVFTNEYIQEDPWYQHVLESDNEIYIFYQREQPDILHIAHVLRSQYDADRVLGVSVVKINLKSIAFRLERATNGNTRVITDSDPLFHQVNKVDRGVIKEVVIDDQKCFMSYIAVSSNVFIVSQVSETTVLAKVHQLRNLILIISGMVFLIGIAVSYFMSDILTGRILKLVAIMQNTDVFSQDSPLDFDNPNDEIGVLYNSFGSMMERNKKLVVEKQELVEKEKDTEIKALQAQIKPHFICNVLNLVSVQALGCEEDDISRILRLLAKVLRYNLKDIAKLVPLENEMEFIKNYLDIQRSLYGDEIRMKLDIEPEVNSLKIISCVVQPIIENSIMHGIANSSYSINIRIKAYAKDSKFYVVVEDDGIGLNAKQMNNMLREDQPSGKGGIGCINVNRRIALRFGEGFGLHYEDCPVGTVAVLVFPILYDERGNKNGK